MTDTQRNNPDEKNIIAEMVKPRGKKEKAGTVMMWSLGVGVLALLMNLGNIYKTSSPYDPNFALLSGAAVLAAVAVAIAAAVYRRSAS
jgi:hypothetical protein